MKNLTLLTSVAAMLPTSATTDRVKGMPVITSGYQGGLIGVLNKQPSVIMFTFTVRPGPHTHTAWAAIG